MHAIGMVLFSRRNFERLLIMHQAPTIEAGAEHK